MSEDCPKSVQVSSESIVLHQRLSTQNKRKRFCVRRTEPCIWPVFLNSIVMHEEGGYTELDPLSDYTQSSRSFEGWTQPTQPGGSILRCASHTDATATERKPSYKRG